MVRFVPWMFGVGLRYILLKMSVEKAIVTLRLLNLNGAFKERQ